MEKGTGMASGKPDRVALFQRLFFLLLFFCIVWAFGFASYLSKVQAFQPPAESADGIVVLTGGPGRIDTGISALVNGQGEKLLISGANRTLDGIMILDIIGIDRELRECCVDLDQRATDTVGNVRESAAWAETNGYRSLIVISADFHLPRSLLLFSSYQDQIEVIPWPVRSQLQPFSLISEYNKYLLTLVRVCLGF